MKNEKIICLLVMFLIAADMSYALTFDETLYRDDKIVEVIKNVKNSDAYTKGDFNTKLNLDDKLVELVNTRYEGDKASFDNKVQTLYVSSGASNKTSFRLNLTTTEMLGLAIALLLVLFIYVRRHRSAGMWGADLGEGFRRLGSVIAELIAGIYMKFVKNRMNLQKLLKDVAENKQTAEENFEKAKAMKTKYGAGPEAYVELHREYENEAREIKSYIDKLDSWRKKTKKLIAGIFVITSDAEFSLDKIRRSLLIEEGFVDKYEKEHFTGEINKKIEDLKSMIKDEIELDQKEKEEVIKLKVLIGSADKINISFKGYVDSVLNPQLKQIKNEKKALEKIKKGLNEPNADLIKKGIDELFDSASTIHLYCNSEIKLYQDIINLEKTIEYTTQQLQAGIGEIENSLRKIGAKEPSALALSVIESAKKQDKKKFVEAMEELFHKCNDSLSMVRVALSAAGISPKEVKEIIKAYYEVRRALPAPT